MLKRLSFTIRSLRVKFSLFLNNIQTKREIACKFLQRLNRYLRRIMIVGRSYCSRHVIGLRRKFSKTKLDKEGLESKSILLLRRSNLRF
jgi:hypothetical protein